MKYIVLTRGKVTSVDDEDYNLLNKYKWYCSTNGRATRNIYVKGKYIREYMHRVIMNAPRGRTVDHIDLDPLNNQKGNLRICTQTENNRNRRKYPKPLTSIYKGVRYRAGHAFPWTTELKVKGRMVHIGNFHSEHIAALAFDLWAKDIHKEFAQTNFQTI